MSLTLDQYADFLDTKDLPWPVPPAVDVPRAKPSLHKLPHVRVVLWNIYGTLLQIPPGGELLFEHPNDFVMNAALDKTIAEFKMWGSMSRKPGQPSEYMHKIYEDVLTQQKMAPSGAEKFPELHSERVWDAIIKRLLQKDYKFDAGFYGSLNEYSRKIAYFFHASLQATACYPTTDAALTQLTNAGLEQGVLADAQCFTMVQLRRGLDKLGSSHRIDELIPLKNRFLSCDYNGRKPSPRLFRHAVDSFAEKGIEPSDILHIGSRIDRDIAPAKKAGMKTALFAGDKSSLGATPDQLKDPATRPDILMTEPDQIAEIVG
ncbi:MAG: HAD family hydrolase [Gemmataceae bacterium]